MSTNMKKILLVMGSSMLVLLGGCSGDPEDVTNQLSDSIISEDKVSENVISWDEISNSEATVNEISENTVSENIVSENETSETTYIIEEDDIINLEEALENWSDINDIQRKITEEEGYVDNGVPIELQDMLLHGKSGNDYAVDYEEITRVNKDNYPIEDILLDANSYSSLMILDIDGDGEDEYFHYAANGNAGWSYLCFHKNVEGKWIDLTVGNSEYGNSILSYEGRYYIRSDSALIWWNDEVETVRPNAVLIDENNPCWNTLVLAKSPTEYTPYELFSNGQDESIDFLENISLDCMEFQDTDVEKIEIKSSHYRWNTNTVPLYINYGFERSYDGEQYLYVITEEATRAYSFLASWDKQIIIMHQTEEGAWEIVKVYYLMTGFHYSLH
ncbi:MAG: hypothetical protein K2J95_06620 [Lachnospiraceae bacterium]|nr:hypothetical protein [Lachnospiraceae bacterium]